MEIYLVEHLINRGHQYNVISTHKLTELNGVLNSSFLKRLNVTWGRWHGKNNYYINYDILKLRDYQTMTKHQRLIYDTIGEYRKKIKLKEFLNG